MAAALGAASLAMVFGPAAGAETVLQKAKRDGIFRAPTADTRMLAAFARAQQTLGGFIDALDGKVAGATGFAVKIAVVDHGKTEYFWINALSHAGSRFSGRINNRPETVTNVTFGQPISFSKGQIRDWSYVLDGRMQGSFTTCVLLSREDPAEAQELKAQIGLTCE